VILLYYGRVRPPFMPRVSYRVKFRRGGPAILKVAASLIFGIPKSLEK